MFSWMKRTQCSKFHECFLQLLTFASENPVNANFATKAQHWTLFAAFELVDVLLPETPADLHGGHCVVQRAANDWNGAKLNRYAGHLLPFHSTKCLWACCCLISVPTSDSTFQGSLTGFAYTGHKNVRLRFPLALLASGTLLQRIFLLSFRIHTDNCHTSGS